MGARADLQIQKTIYEYPLDERLKHYRDELVQTIQDLQNPKSENPKVMIEAFSDVEETEVLPLLEKGKDKKIVNMYVHRHLAESKILLTLSSSTSMGSIAYTKNYSFAPTHAYKISKAALNMLTTQYAMELEDQGFTVIAVSPGVSVTGSVL